MRLHLLAFGKLKTPGMADAAAHYARHLHASGVELKLTELKSVALPDKSDASRRKAQGKEANLLLEAIEPATPLFLLDEKGKAQSSQAWAQWLGQQEESGHSEIALAIGSSMGFDESVRKRARGLLSLGPQTLPHELARVALLEQLFRASSIRRGHPYHNEGS